MGVLASKAFSLFPKWDANCCGHGHRAGVAKLLQSLLPYLPSTE